MHSTSSSSYNLSRSIGVSAFICFLSNLNAYEKFTWYLYRCSTRTSVLCTQQIVISNGHCTLNNSTTTTTMNAQHFQTCSRSCLFLHFNVVVLIVIVCVCVYVPWSWLNRCSCFTLFLFISNENSGRTSERAKWRCRGNKNLMQTW